ncbi:MAG TPA: type II toxin-antitoxin system VapC family toxin [Bryobacteraceae bacterium]|nr:type II toxin-antitoxin system VapC family toxin [Bryobacteraceae bacterium]
MIVPDVNILLHAYNADSKVHSPAKEWWEETVAGPRPVGLPWASILGFIRLITRRGVFPNPIPPVEAARRVRTWLALPAVQIITPGESHAEILFGLLEHLGTAGDLTTDAHLAALAIEYQAELASTDVDFARFPKLRWFNPLRLR